MFFTGKSVCSKNLFEDEDIDKDWREIEGEIKLAQCCQCYETLNEQLQKKFFEEMQNVQFCPNKYILTMDIYQRYTAWFYLLKDNYIKSYQEIKKYYSNI